MDRVDERYVTTLGGGLGIEGDLEARLHSLEPEFPCAMDGRGLARKLLIVGQDASASLLAQAQSLHGPLAEDWGFGARAGGEVMPREVAESRGSEPSTASIRDILLQLLAGEHDPKQFGLSLFQGCLLLEEADL